MGILPRRPVPAAECEGAAVSCALSAAKDRNAAMEDIAAIPNKTEFLQPDMMRFFSFACVLLVPVGRADEASFRRDLAPVLVQKCLVCHGPKKAKGSYRVDTLKNQPGTPANR